MLANYYEKNVITHYYRRTDMRILNRNKKWSRVRSNQIIHGSTTHETKSCWNALLPLPTLFYFFSFCVCCVCWNPRKSHNSKSFGGDVNANRKSQITSLLIFFINRFLCVCFQAINMSSFFLTLIFLVLVLQLLLLFGVLCSVQCTNWRMKNNHCHKV